MSKTYTPDSTVSSGEDPVYRIADERIEVSPEDGTIIVDGVLLEGVQGTKFNILALLASQPDCTIPMQRLYSDIWGYEDGVTASNTARMHVSTLRRMLGPELGDPAAGAIVTKSGVGYRAVSSLHGGLVLPHDETHQVSLIADERIAVDVEGLSVRSDGRLLGDVTPTEFRILSELAARPDRVIGLETLMLSVWGHADRGMLGTVRANMSTLRKRFGPELGNAASGALRTRREIGYYAVRSLGER